MAWPKQRRNLAASLTLGFSLACRFALRDAQPNLDFSTIAMALLKLNQIPYYV
jgi:hypothetical protein